MTLTPSESVDSGSIRDDPVLVQNCSINCVVSRDERGFSILTFDRYCQEASDDIQVFVFRAEHVVFPTPCVFVACRTAGIFLYAVG